MFRKHNGKCEICHPFILFPDMTVLTSHDPYLHTEQNRETLRFPWVGGLAKWSGSPWVDRVIRRLATPGQGSGLNRPPLVETVGSAQVEVGDGRDGLQKPGNGLAKTKQRPGDSPVWSFLDEEMPTVKIRIDKVHGQNHFVSGYPKNDPSINSSTPNNASKSIKSNSQHTKNKRRWYPQQQGGLRYTVDINYYLLAVAALIFNAT